ncbi:MAG: glycerol-3-phosphate dehydrogenase/oxidase [Acidobacteria bacterium]|nr:glycerol-3-phosphate dehydrogenase/oxidase [Acidobacteriota bacterium]
MRAYKARGRFLKRQMMRRIPQDISGTAFDVIVIGAGINGACIARDAATRGLRVLLLDKGDLSCGTTSWSTRLIHGGLRYLEHGELGLVRESLRERETLLRIAPHLVRPLPLLLPIYEGARRGPLTIRAGMLAYDLLSPGKTLPRHRMLSRAEALQHTPVLEAKGLRGAALFHDAQVEYAERLVFENALSALRRGARILTYARVERLLSERGRVAGVEFTDLLGGGGRHTAHAPLVVNVAGPWVDEVLAGAGDAGGVEKLIGGTKGSHIVVASFPGAPETALYIEAQADARPFFIIPWDEKLLVGTTDEMFTGDLERVEAGTAEIEYLIGETNRAIPSARLTRASVLYAYAGVRPLPFIRAREEGGITRRHFIRESRFGGLFSIVGGKLTTSRSLSEQAVEMLFERLERRVPACTTARELLPGAATAAGEGFHAYAESFPSWSGLPAKSSSRLLKIYGTRAEEVCRLAAEHAELREPISEETGSIGAEVVFAFRHELAETLGDCLLRRTLVGLDSSAGTDAVESAARLSRKFLGWDKRRAACEVEDYLRYVERFHVKKTEARL